MARIVCITWLKKNEACAPSQSHNTHVLCRARLEEVGGVFGISSGAWRPRQSAVEEEGRSCWMVLLLDDSLPCQSALIHSFARTCIRTHRGARTHTPSVTRGHVGEEVARARVRWLLLEGGTEGWGGRF